MFVQFGAHTINISSIAYVTTSKHLTGELCGRVQFKSKRSIAVPVENAGELGDLVMLLLDSGFVDYDDLTINPDHIARISIDERKGLATVGQIELNDGYVFNIPSELKPIASAVVQRLVQVTEAA